MMPMMMSRGLRVEGCRMIVMMMLVLILMERDDRDDKVYMIHGK